MSKQSGDMLVNLMRLPQMPEIPEGIKIKRAIIVDREAILRFVSESFPASPAWVSEVEKALFQNPGTCFIAVKEKEVVGFACYDTTALDYFGPTGVKKDVRGKGIGGILLIKTLYAMREAGYTYAIIGAVSDAAEFYKKLLGAEFIEGADLEHSAYANMIRM